MHNTQEIITAFYASIEHKDFDALRNLLHDALKFEGPNERIENADSFVATLTSMAHVTESFRVKHLFVDGDRACCVFDLITATPLRESPVSEYFELREGRIASIRAHFDSHPWIALYAKESS